MFGIIQRLISAVKLVVVDLLYKMAVALGFAQSVESIIASNPTALAAKNRKIENILRDFPNDRINAFDWDTGDETEAADAILNDSVTDQEKRHDLSKTLARSMRQIRGYQKLCSEVEERRLTKFNPQNSAHEDQLKKLWRLMKPDEPLLARRSVQWQDIGFQGDDPATDFRGMGMLGLDQLVFFAQYDVDNCRYVYALSIHPAFEFPFAVCGITMTALAKELLFDDLLKNHFYNAFRNSPPMDSFHQVYCRVFTLFAKFWELSEPVNVMEFNLVKSRFLQRLEAYLERADANLLDAKPEDVFRCGGDHC